MRIYGPPKRLIEIAVKGARGNKEALKRRLEIVFRNTLEVLTNNKKSKKEDLK